MTKKIEVLIVDDHEVTRLGLATMLAGSELEVVGTAATGEEGVKQARKLRPDVVVLDIGLPDMDGLAVLDRIKADRRTTPVLILSGYDNPTYIARAFALGASGYLLKGASRQELLAGIRKSAAGELVWTREEHRRVTGALATPRLAADVDIPLTKRESEVLRLLASGQTNKEIAEALKISYETVKEHVQHILQKLGVSDRTQAAILSVRKGLV